MGRIIIIIAALLLPAALFSATYRDASGCMTGSSSTSGGRTVYRDASGRMTGSSSTSGGRTVYRDANGRTAGTRTGR